MKIEKFIFNPFHENTYLVYDEVTKDAVVIDCGCYTQKEKNTLLSFINQHQLTIKYVLNTHLHIDHIFGNKFLFSQFGIEPQAHKGDIELLERMQEQALAFGLSLKEKEQSIGNFIDEKNSLTIGESSIQFIHVPGHSLGSLCIYFPKEKWLFSGDVLFLRCIGRTDLPGGNYAQLIDGIHNKLLVLPKETRVFAGHGFETTIGYEQENNPFLC
ncbi:MAG: MBL fold metallo-hydrolase [Paludibacteraceae bacterium]|nr:MBL fold metallo-hydrolase [Paludibacteraceae bacterium]